MFIFFSNGNGSAFENNLDSGLLSQASLRDVRRLRCWKCYSGHGQRLWDYGMEQSFNAVSVLCVAVERRGSTLTWTVCKAIDGSRLRKAANLYDVLIRGQRWIVKRRRSDAFSHRGAHFCLRGCWEEGEIWRGSPQWTTKAQLPKPQTATVAAAQIQVKERIPEQKRIKKGQRVLRLN